MRYLTQRAVLVPWAGRTAQKTQYVRTQGRARPIVLGCGSATLAILLALLTAPTTAEPIQILRAGVWSGDQVTVQGGDDWWGIFPEGDSFTLQSALVSVTAAHAPMTNGKGPMTGKKVSLASESKPLILIRGLKNPVPGPLVAGTVAPGPYWTRDVTKLDRYINPGETLHLVTDGADRMKKFVFRRWRR